MSAFYTWQNNDLILNCYLQPKAKKDEIVGTHNDALKIRITAPPVDGKANKYLLAFLAKQFEVPKSHISLISGELSRNKRIKVKNPLKLPEWLHED